MKPHEPWVIRAGRPAILAAALLAGCALTPVAAVDIKKDVLSELPADLPRAKGHGGSLLVLPIRAAPAYDSARIAYAVQPYEIAYFGRHEWAAAPSRMLEPLLVRTFEHTGHFAAVVAAPSAGRHRYALRTELLELLQDFTTEPPMLELSLRVQLIGAADDRVLATREIAVREAMREKTPHAGVVAANAATAKALKEVAGFVLERTR